MQHRFSFRSIPGASSNCTEANVFIHGYSAGHCEEDRNNLIGKVSGQLDGDINIFAFWPSNHYLHFDLGSLNKSGAPVLLAAATLFGAPLVAAGTVRYVGLAGSVFNDRRKNFLQARSRAERMGLVLLRQLAEYLRTKHPKVKTVNLIGHSLGGRVAVSCLRALPTDSQLMIKDVLLMAAAVEVSPVEMQIMCARLQGRLINAYSSADRTLVLNLGESCLGRNAVEHAENIEMDGFGHTEYWSRLAEVLAKARFRTQSPSQRSVAQKLVSHEAQAFEASLKLAEEKEMKLELESPKEIYQKINDELAGIVNSLGESSTDESLDNAKEEARSQLVLCQQELIRQLDELEQNAEWNTFTIAFYGETGAGKSTIIETLRILLKEPQKLQSQQAFRAAWEEYGLHEQQILNLQDELGRLESSIRLLEQRLAEVKERYEPKKVSAETAIEVARAQGTVLVSEKDEVLRQRDHLCKQLLAEMSKLQRDIVERQRAASIWHKVLNFFRKAPEAIALAEVVSKLESAEQSRLDISQEIKQAQQATNKKLGALERALADIDAECGAACDSLMQDLEGASQQIKSVVEKQEEERAAQADLVGKLKLYADGDIIGDGRADFTRETQRYDFSLNGHPFALLDVPGIEGHEGLVLSEIERAVQTAHAVFYVTNQAAPPQTGDQQRKGTLEKIKSHLGAQTEVWAIFNKKITNPKHSLMGRPLTSDDENASLETLNEKMREQLGEHYRAVLSLTARPAFLASTNHLVPGTKDAKDRDKCLADFSVEDLLEQSRVAALLQFLRSELIDNSGAKIKRANFNKANDALKQVASALNELQHNFSALSEKLEQEGGSAEVQLNTSFKAFQQRLQASGETLIDTFAEGVRKRMYGRIDADISNDSFKGDLVDTVQDQQEQLNASVSKTMAGEVESFQHDAESILKRFHEQAQELMGIYAKISNTQLRSDLDLKIELDSGLKISNLLALLVGGALMFWNPAGWFIAALGATSILVGSYKAVRGFFSADYKKAQQRKSVDDNLRSITNELREALRNGLDDALPEMKQAVSTLQEAIAEPRKQALAITQTLKQANHKLKALSLQVEYTGSL